ncbi:anaerobic ribonucleoside-triphosphate reductase activating protein [Bifidobacterium subtile]|uniref:Anaerobic ribonucleoside-triphosphate reductase activating protein n=1 Tax=Bifidobacterium subtile TaxID=77635 RepID=A0A087DU65_9BIFI|nr:anaerobic ribonucleoside-triphosphate reductase activating protein [Bifidobacterium subtile]KFI99065.1 anaerobic ribonucleoside-triphosphate reductase activating protein [Bifidobacterium subtile]QOL36921.1 anaerobic ribonucleoside-triphosphate reductase activating protein [Bifidobacterium subtile]
MVAQGKLHDFARTDPNRGPGVPCALSNNPRAGQWRSDRMSHNMVADYKRFLMTDGEGIRCSLYVSGCPFHCMECYNSSIWDFWAGIEYSAELEDKIVEDIGQNFVQGITFLGGEPLLNTGILIPLAKRLRKEFGHEKDIWCWTGYTWEELMRPGESEDKLELLHLVDILVDGRYIKTLHDSLLQFRGSSNQRIIDVPQSFAQGKPVIWAKLHDQERFIPEVYGKDRASGEGDAS